jgi:GntR family transcriptional regulator
MMESSKVVYCVSLSSPIAVYVQIENQVRFAVAGGYLKPGDTLPSVREMSAALGINPNTVTKAYRDLELMGLVTTRRGVGVTIAPDAVKKCAAETKQMVLEHLRDSVAECLAAGISATDVKKTVAKNVDEKPTPYSSGTKP